MTPDSPERALTGATVLVADDNQSNLFLMQRILESAGVTELHPTADPRDVLRLFRETDPDIVLLDLHMPGLDGIAVMEELRRSAGRGEFVPIVVLTADATPVARERALAAGADDFLTKPLDTTEVVLRVRNLLHTRSLHERLRAHNDELRTEVEEARAERGRADADAEAKRERIRRIADGGRFRTVFQPIVDLGSRKVVGYEALSRFDERPLRPPNEWFDEAAEVGLGAELELAAVEAALRCEDLPGAVLLTVNLSPETATSQRLVDVLAGQAPGTVALEITEHARVQDYDSLSAALEPLRAAGVLLAVDDAGAGFSSLSHILQLQPDIIKLDMSLVRHIDQNPVQRALSSSLVTFAGEIGARIIAEGIETAAECLAVEDLGVAWAQGYHLGRPAALPAMTDRQSERTATSTTPSQS